MSISREKIRISRITFYWFLLFSIFNYVNSSIAQDVPLRVSEPKDSVIADLKSYIPKRMNEADVPGLAIALVRNNQIIWEEGFGVVNRLTGKPVSSKTVFEVASISKVITAYTAFRLVDEGKLLIDKPVHTYLMKPWLPPSDFADKITLRHLFSHSSGLRDDLFFRNKRIIFEPGTDFLYSGFGAEYMREIIEQMSGESIEEEALEKVFKPLNMTGSSFVDDTNVMNLMANGHMRYSLIFLFFLVPFIIVLVIVGIITLILNRLINQKWGVSWQLKIGAVLTAFLLSELVLYILIGKPFPNLILMTILCAFVFFVFLFLNFVFIRRMTLFIKSLNQKKGVKVLIATLWMIICLVIFLKITGSISGPVPKNHSDEASAIGSLRSTAPDLANFLIELSNPKYLSKTLGSQIDSTQIKINQDFSWGLGIGIQHSSNGDAIWQNANTFAFRGFMVIYPHEGYGVVVLTNSETGLPVAYDIAGKALGGKANWKSF